MCKDADEQALQKVIDYACGGGADCTQIQMNGACYQPNTVKNHCDVAVNNYYQKKASTGATCDFNGAAVISTSTTSSIPSVKTLNFFHQTMLFLFADILFTLFLQLLQAVYLVPGTFHFTYP